MEGGGILKKYKVIDSDLNSSFVLEKLAVGGYVWRWVGGIIMRVDVFRLVVN